MKERAYPTVMLADDHPVWIEGLAIMLNEAGFEIVAKVVDGLQAIEAARRYRPDLAILDIAMPRVNGIEATCEIRRLSPNTRCIMLTVHSDERYVLEALRAGAQGYIPKTRPFGEIADAIKEVAEGGIHLNSALSRYVVQAYLTGSARSDKVLTTRERQVLQLVAEGYSTREIASLLALSIKTVESHRARIMRKLKLHNIAELVRYAVRTGLVHL